MARSGAASIHGEKTPDEEGAGLVSPLTVSHRHRKVQRMVAEGAEPTALIPEHGIAIAIADGSHHA